MSDLRTSDPTETSSKAATNVEGFKRGGLGLLGGLLLCGAALAAQAALLHAIAGRKTN